jgi:predicted lipoprotein with Yx(FWY)xxD motif
MRIKNRQLLSVPVALCAVALLAGVQTHSAAASPGAGRLHAAVALTHVATLGTIITDHRGMTLYYYTPDKGRVPTCTGGCARAWPPAFKSHSMKFPKLHVPGKFGTVANPAGGRQITYNGWPLYTFVQDRKRGQTKGQGIGGVWFVATPKLKRAIHTSNPTPSPAPMATATCTPDSYVC